MNNKLSEDPVYKLWVLLHQARDVLHKVREREVDKYGVTAEQSASPFLISANGGSVTPSLISNWMLREPHTISVLLNKMEEQGFDIIGLLIKLFAASGVAAWTAAFLTNKRGQNRILDAILDFVELLGANINKAKNDPTA